MKICRFIIVLVFLNGCLNAIGQDDIEKLLLSIEENNPAINALKAQLEYQKANVRTEMLPSNPVAEFGRFPSSMGDGIKYAWGVSQHFEFPTVYGKRAGLAKKYDQFYSVQANTTRQEILLEAKLLILEIVHHKKMLNDYREREIYAQKMIQDFQKRLDAGDASILDYNNATLRHLDFSLKVKETESTINLLINRLISLNGNKTLSIPDLEIPFAILPSKDSLINIAKQTDPRFTAAESMVGLAESELSLTKHQGLPELEIGYASEKTDSEHFAGFKAGISIPLWGNAKKTKAAKLQLNAARYEMGSFVSELEFDYTSNYLEAENFYQQISELRKVLDKRSNIIHLTKAYELGQVSSFDLFQEMIFYYELFDRIAEYELEYQKTLATLFRFEL